MQLGSSSTRTMGIMDGSTAPQPSLQWLSRDSTNTNWCGLRNCHQRKREKKRLLTTLTTFWYLDSNNPPGNL